MEKLASASKNGGSLSHRRKGVLIIDMGIVLMAAFAVMARKRALLVKGASCVNACKWHFSAYLNQWRAFLCSVDQNYCIHICKVNGSTCRSICCWMDAMGFNRLKLKFQQIRLFRTAWNDDGHEKSSTLHQSHIFHFICRIWRPTHLSRTAISCRIRWQQGTCWGVIWIDCMDLMKIAGIIQVDGDCGGSSRGDFCYS